MKARIFSNIEELNKYLENVKATDIMSIVHNFQVEGQTLIKSGSQNWQIIDRFLVVEK